MAIDDKPEPSDMHGRFIRDSAEGRRIVILDSATYTDRHIAAESTAPDGEVLVAASYMGVYCAKLLIKASPFAAIGCDCGIGKDGAGIAGLWYLEALGVGAAAVDVQSMELGDGQDMWNSGIISRVNWLADELGVHAGQSVVAAAELLASAIQLTVAADPTNRQVVVERPDGHNVVATNSIADALPEDYDVNVLCTAGHTGRSVIDYIIGFRPFGFICSDGGIGKNNSGLAALQPANEAGIPGAAVSANSARMGDGLSTYEDGIISAANDLATTFGVRIGMPARQAALLLAERKVH